MSPKESFEVLAGSPGLGDNRANLLPPLAVDS